MKEIIPKDSRYIPLVQQKYCCSPTSMLMVMLRHGIPLVPQEVLGYYLGLIVPPPDKKFFWNVRTGKSPSAGYGTQIKKFDPNKAFKKLNIPLQFNFHPISKFSASSFVKFMAQGVKQDKDLLVCFNHAFLNQEKGQVGHVCVLDRIYPNRGLIRLIDPQQSQPKWRIVKIQELHKATVNHGDSNMAGFWELKKI